MFFIENLLKKKKKNSINFEGWEFFLILCILEKKIADICIMMLSLWHTQWVKCKISVRLQSIAPARKRRKKCVFVRGFKKSPEEVSKYNLNNIFLPQDFSVGKKFTMRKTQKVSTRYIQIFYDDKKIISFLFV